MKLGAPCGSTADGRVSPALLARTPRKTACRAHRRPFKIWRQHVLEPASILPRECQVEFELLTICRPLTPSCVDESRSCANRRGGGEFANRSTMVPSGNTSTPTCWTLCQHRYRAYKSPAEVGAILAVESLDLQPDPDPWPVTPCSPVWFPADSRVFGMAMSCVRTSGAPSKLPRDRKALRGADPAARRDT